MPQSNDYFCHLCGEFIAERDDPTYVTIGVHRPGDRLGTPFDPKNVPPFAALVGAMKLPVMDACSECLFVGTMDAAAARTGPPVFQVNIVPALKDLLIQNGAHPDHPGLPYEDVEVVLGLGKGSTIGMEPRWRPVYEAVYGAPTPGDVARYNAAHGIFTEAAPAPGTASMVPSPAPPVP